MEISPPRVALLSLEPWDEVWRRNQHLTQALIRQGLVDHVTYVEPPTRSHGGAVREVGPRLRIVTPPLLASPRWGSTPLAAYWLRRHALENVDHIWINNAPLGRWLLGKASCYDVTDDWRETAQGWATRVRLIRAEDKLAERVSTIVCSRVLQERWRTRYGVHAGLVPNAVDISTYVTAARAHLPGQGPHFVYVGTLHEERLDTGLVLTLAEQTGGTVHLIGPNHLAEAHRQRLNEVANVRMSPQVASAEVPSLLMGADVLILPHVITPFTLSLNAIKAYEYLATDRPVVATPTSGFQDLDAVGLWLAKSAAFVRAALAAADEGAVRRPPVPTWDDRARDFARLAWPAPN